MARAREVAAWPNYRAGSAAVHVFRRAYLSGQLAMRVLTGLIVRPSLRSSWRQDRYGSQSDCGAVFLAEVDMDGVLYD